VIAETLRRDLPIVDTVTDLTRELALLTAHSSDLIADRVRMINRLRDMMTSVFRTLEQQFDYSSHKGALILLTEYASPKRLRRPGETRLIQWLRRRHVRDAARLAARALAAARGQDIELPGQQVAEMIIAELAASLTFSIDPPTPSAASLTTSLRFPVAGHRPVVGRPLRDGRLL
jgi:hypothetical protein